MTDALCQHFTPPWLVDRVARMAYEVFEREGRPLRLLEPSAGTGNIAIALKAIGIGPLTCVELDRKLIPTLQAAVEYHGPPNASPHTFTRVVHRDFLLWADDLCAAGGAAEHGPIFDLSVGNPPFDDGQDTDHVYWQSRVAHRVINVLRVNFLCGDDRYKRVWKDCILEELDPCADRPDFPGPDGTSGSGGPRHDMAVFQLRRVPDVGGAGSHAHQPAVQWLREVKRARR